MAVSITGSPGSRAPLLSPIPQQHAGHNYGAVAQLSLEAELEDEIGAVCRRLVTPAVRRKAWEANRNMVRAYFHRNYQPYGAPFAFWGYDASQAGIGDYVFVGPPGVS